MPSRVVISVNWFVRISSQFVMPGFQNARQPEGVRGSFIAAGEHMPLFA